jgi:hypothetical protein
MSNCTTTLTLNPINPTLIKDAVNAGHATVTTHLDPPSQVSQSLEQHRIVVTGMVPGRDPKHPEWTTIKLGITRRKFKAVAPVDDDYPMPSESKDKDQDHLSEDEAGSEASSNAMGDPYSYEIESDSEYETVSSGKSATLSKSMTREDKPFSDEQICFGLEDHSDSEVEDDAAKPAFLSGMRVFGSTRGGKHSGFFNPSFNTTVPIMKRLKDTNPTTYVANNDGCELNRDPNAKNIGLFGLRDPGPDSDSEEELQAPGM